MNAEHRHTYIAAGKVAMLSLGIVFNECGTPTHIHVLHSQSTRTDSPVQVRQVKPANQAMGLFLAPLKFFFSFLVLF